MNGRDDNASGSILTERWMTAAIVIITLLFLSINWYYYRKTRSALDTEFSDRLKALASLAASSVDESQIRSISPELAGFGDPDSITNTLDMIRAGHDLASINLLREDGIVIISTRPDIFTPGDLYPHWNMDYEQILSALEGVPASTGLYQSPGGGFIKAGYAPIGRYGGPASFVVAAEADADFLSGMNDLRAILIISTAVSLAGLVIFIWLVYKATGSLIRTRESLLHAETLASMGRMAAGIAHEVRNPLFIIRGSAERLKKQHPEDATEIDDLILDEVDRLNGILTDYLLFARNESTNYVETDLIRLLERSVRLIIQPAESGNIDIELKKEIDAAPFAGEEKKLQQVFMNLLLNAIQAMEGSGKLTVSIERSRSGYTLDFADTGPGIPERDIEKVFEPFYTTRASGSGLGLAIAKRVVEDHGGEIRIGSNTGRGAIVTIMLPLRGTRPGEADE